MEKKTKDKIKDLIDPESIDEDTAMILVNAIYFKGKWKTEFNKTLTKTEKFFVAKDESVDVDMMSQSSNFYWKSVKDLDATIIELPYEEDVMRMYIILPNKKDGLDSLETKLDNITVDEVHDILKMNPYPQILT